MPRLWMPLWMSLWLLTGCENSHPRVGGETHWLQVCQSDDECGLGGCVCGVCSFACKDDHGCPDDLECRTAGDDLYEDTCARERTDVEGLCAPTCEDDACADQTMSSATPSGEERLFIDANLDVDATCNPAMDDPLGAGMGIADVSVSGDEMGEGCREPYLLRLRVKSDLAEDVLVSAAAVTIKTITDEVVLFDQSDPPLPDPFTPVVASPISVAQGTTGQGAAVFEGIPTAYLAQLGNFANNEEVLVLHIRLSGETASGVPVHSNLFRYPVRMCQGCLTMCQTAMANDGLGIEDLDSGTCHDNAGADGRYCIDPDC